MCAFNFSYINYFIAFEQILSQIQKVLCSVSLLSYLEN